MVSHNDTFNFNWNAWSTISGSTMACYYKIECSSPKFQALAISTRAGNKQTIF